MRCQIWSGSRWRRARDAFERNAGCAPSPMTARTTARYWPRYHTLGWISSELVCWLIKSRLKLERRRKIRFSGFRPISAFIEVVRRPQLFCHEWKLFSRSNYIARFRAHPSTFMTDVGNGKTFAAVCYKILRLLREMRSHSDQVYGGIIHSTRWRAMNFFNHSFPLILLL